LTLEMALKSNGGAKHCTVNSGVVTTRRHNWLSQANRYTLCHGYSV
jgi:hypothetical protein